MKPIILCGPTASGKTELALELARQTDGIIISADSRQVYTNLTAGTAKPQGTWENGIYWVEGIPYYLVDFLAVTETFNAGAFRKFVEKIVWEHPGKQLIFAGGTGMYLHAYFVGMDELPASTPKTRELLLALLAKEGKEGLHAALAAKDPASANQIPAANVQRTMRALELYMLTGRPASELKSGNFTNQDLENAKLSMKANLLNNEGTGAKLGAINAGLNSKYGITYTNQLFNEIDKITKQDIVDFADKIFKNPPVYSIVASKDTLENNNEFFKTLEG